MCLPLRVCGVFLLLILMLPLSATAAPVGPTLNSGVVVREGIIQNLTKEGYLAHFSNGQGFQRGVSAYLWDNRNWLKNVNFNNAKQVDVVICLMNKKGYVNFSAHATEQTFMNWCEGMLVD
ncbi:MAG: hypothetical protein QNK24_10060 [Desulfuromusa sp.]|nr:hypothetical protein [Desulfuromusa sp.]